MYLKSNVFFRNVFYVYVTCISLLNVMVRFVLFVHIVTLKVLITS